jgi:hypothetical protein
MRDKQGRTPVDVALQRAIVPGRPNADPNTSTAELLRQLVAQQAQ